MDDGGKAEHEIGEEEKKVLSNCSDYENMANKNRTHAKGRKQKIRNCGVLDQDIFLVRYAKMLVEWPPFEAFILIVIAANCIVMALEEHHPDAKSMVR